MSVTSSLPGTLNGSGGSGSYRDDDGDVEDGDVELGDEETRSSLPEFVDLTVVLPDGQLKLINVEYG
jgi:hypothetical protein